MSDAALILSVVVFFVLCDLYAQACSKV